MTAITPLDSQALRNAGVSSVYPDGTYHVRVDISAAAIVSGFLTQLAHAWDDDPETVADLLDDLTAAQRWVDDPDSLRDQITCPDRAWDYACDTHFEAENALIAHVAGTLLPQSLRLTEGAVEALVAGLRRAQRGQGAAA